MDRTSHRGYLCLEPCTPWTALKSEPKESMFGPFLIFIHVNRGRISHTHTHTRAHTNTMHSCKAHTHTMHSCKNQRTPTLVFGHSHFGFLPSVDLLSLTATQATSDTQEWHIMHYVNDKSQRHCHICRVNLSRLFQEPRTTSSK